MSTCTHKTNETINISMWYSCCGRIWLHTGESF